MRKGAWLPAFAMALMLALPAAPKAAIIEYAFVGILDTPIVDLNGVDLPAGTGFTGSFSYDENAPDTGGSVVPISRSYFGEAFTLSIEGVAGPFVSDFLSIRVTPYNDVGLVFTAQSSTLGEIVGFLNVFASLTPQVVNPLLLLPDGDDLVNFAVAAIAFGPPIPEQVGLIDDVQGTVTSISGVPLPAAAWLFLSAIAGLGVLRWRRR